MIIANHWERAFIKLKKELNRRNALPSLLLGVLVYFFVNYLFAGAEFYRLTKWRIGQSNVYYAIFTFNLVWILSSFSSEILNSWFKQIVYQGIAGGITGSFVKEEIKSSIAISSATFSFYIILVLLSTISDIGLISFFLIKGILIGILGGIIGIRFYKEISEGYEKNEEQHLRVK